MKDDKITRKIENIAMYDENPSKEVLYASLRCLKSGHQQFNQPLRVSITAVS